MNYVRQCHVDTFMAELHACALPRPTLFLTPCPQRGFFFPLRIATADRFLSCTLSQPLGCYMSVSPDKSLLTEHKGWESSEDAG